ncbi:hypothetical protein ACFC14_18590 [Microbacterium sp. NPDC055988]|uniref:hypothetical protein n=1 Tax=Microbacterium sp. NPDC055988 TaxID=3345671 RepID=UPI0035DE226E
MSRGVPSTSWAMSLAGTDHRYRFLCFDLDVKTPAAADQMPRDLQLLTSLLDELRIAYVVCVSGPTGGRHVWVALSDHQDAAAVAQLGRLAKASLPTLDYGMLSNPVAGCARPPGAPHRLGGASVPVAGSLDALRAPSTSNADFQALTDRFAELALARPAESEQSAPETGPLPVDEHGRLYLPGARRDLSPDVAAAVDTAVTGDASATLWKILLGAAAARWRHADVAALVMEGKPGLERVRTIPGATGRVARPRGGSKSPAAVLRTEWDKAVRQIASSGAQGSDPTFESRAAAIATHVRELQERADASVGRWQRGAGPTERRILDVLSVLALQAVNARVEADIRRLAVLAGIGRETARTALRSLASDGWIVRAAVAEGPHGALWSIDPKNVLHRESDPSRSQADTPRGSAERETLLQTLTRRIHAATHDVFSHGGSLGLRTGNLFARLTEQPSPTPAIAAGLGVSVGWVASRLSVLGQFGLAEHHVEGWTVPGVDRRGAVAELLNVAGRLEARRRRYDVERELWAWWRAEEEWMSTPPHKRRRRPGPTQLALLPDAGTNRHGAHPRRADGTADYRVARAIIEGVPVETAVARAGDAASTVEEIIGRVLGGRLVATEPVHAEIPHDSRALVLTA